jgi:hypothetical protein
MTMPVLTAIFAFLFTQSAQAQVHIRPIYETSDNCIKCHENLYFLHDTGNWYCLMESPMTCTQCHGGDPSALTQDEAHLGRAAHPVINEDISKCQECHPEQCYERVDLFDQVAGISEIKIAAPYTPAFKAETSDLVEIQIEQETSPWINLWELLPIVLLVGAALLVYIAYRIRHRRQ